MKKLILFAVVLCFASSISAQIRFGVKAGGNFSNLYTSGSNTGWAADQYKGRFGYHFGGMMEYSFSDMFSIQPELIYINHGATLKSNNSFSMSKGHVMLNTIQLPVNLKASFHVGDNRLFVYAGPYAAYNMYGHAKGKIDGKSESIKAFSKDSDMKRFDYGVGVGVGMEFNKIIVSVGNQFGLADIHGASGSKMKAGNLTLSVGYFF